jgi:hypothetical protein
MCKLNVPLFGTGTSLLLSSLVLLGCKPERKPVALVIDVWMNQSLENVTGKPWPRAKAGGAPLGMTAVEQPCEVALHLPSTRTLNLRSRQTTLQQERGIVTLVSVLPLDELVEFETAIAKAEEIARQQNIQDRKFQETLSHWRDAPPNRDPFGPKYMARVAIEPGVNMYVFIKPSAVANGWFIALEFQKAAGPSAAK